jgi:predicted GIY-YIG superfamily endonuclease
MTQRWHCYLLQSTDKQRTYIGATVAPDRRVRQHNGKISGGARATKGREWVRIILVSGFPDEVAALQFEWAWKYRSRKFGKGLKARFQGLQTLLTSTQSTSKAIPFSEWIAGPPTIHLESTDPTIQSIFDLCNLSQFLHISPLELSEKSIPDTLELLQNPDLQQLSTII